MVVYLAAIAACVLSVVQVQEQILPEIAGIIVYALAAVSLTVSCIWLVQDVRGGVAARVLSFLRRNPFGEKFFDDYTFRTVLTTLPAFVINVAYTVYNGVIGILNQSAWFITMAVYYSLLGIMRYRAVKTERDISRMEDPDLIRKRELSVIKTNGILLLLLNLALSGVVMLTIVQDTARRYSEIIAIAIAAYTFYKITISVVNMIKVRKLQSPILITIRNIGVADALVSILTLQMMMLASFQERNTLNTNWMNSITGLGVSILISLLGVSMIRYAWKRKPSQTPRSML